jgi:hypothetical protein
MKGSGSGLRLVSIYKEGFILKDLCATFRVVFKGISSP